ncbi:MAG: ErpK protein [Eubacteriales bacterium]|jgi:Arc/MetJ family transcription regulator
MARRTISIEEKIAAQEQEVLKAKKKYEAENSKLKELYRKRDEGRQKELLEAIAGSSRSYEEIMAFIQSDSDGNE